ncbi:hypothetical protein DL766_002551 [Monosporascus sp. MC13-8B]|uniref:Cytochrome P450 n=1 Tax=Monosporascus cannonballus TaxID=155416 RepID=A0ABY0GS75_9PEZI|nr:hypothetical protein DL762_010002 [Monosporascus cannonballus]RYP01056.1 hypothetical protein DL763_000477 [Monosporascus cannonballus]RYP35375.1 hypothetical protein DL766_002551 [Monosporascus sp. MC13-8B]
MPNFVGDQKTHAFAGILPNAHPSLETFDPRFKKNRELVKDLMAPSFLDTRCPTGLGGSKSHIGRQLASLESVAASGSCVNPADNLEQPVAFPTSQASDELKALRVDEQSLWLAFYMPSPRIYHFLNKLRPSVGFATRMTRSALDYIVQREIKAAKEAGRPPMFDDPRIRDELYTYLLAGHDTIAGTLTWAVRRLSAYPDIQKRVRLDLRQTYSELDAFIEEILRHDSPIPTTALTARKDTLILGHPIPKNTYLFLNLTGPSFTAPAIAEARRSKTSKLGKGARTSWDNSQPDAFNPERWLKRDDDRRVSFDPSSGPMLAFSAGPREFDPVSEELNLFWDVDEFIVTMPKKCFVKVSAAT